VQAGWGPAPRGTASRRKTMDTARLGQGTQPAYALIRREVPFIEADEPLKAYLDAMSALVKSGAFCPPPA